MVSVTLPVDQLRPRLEKWGEDLSVATINGPSSVVVSGTPAALAELLAECAEEGIWARQVPVDYASHSAQVERIERVLAELLAPVAPRPAEIAFHSTVTGEITDGTLLDAGYWYRNLRQTVRFEQVVRDLVDQGYRTFVESSPHPILTMAVEQTVDATGGAGVTVVGSLRRGDGGPRRFLHSLAVAGTAGAPVRWAELFDGRARRVELPTYAFQRRRYWMTPLTGFGDVSAVGLRDTGHPLLGAALPLAEGAGWLLTGQVSTRTQPWLADHAVLDTVLVPGTAFVDFAACAAARVGCDLIEELTLAAPLVLAEDVAVDLQVRVGGADEDGRRPVAVHSRGSDESDEDGWTCHASGTVAATGDTAASRPVFEFVDSWPADVDDHAARRDWGFAPEYDFERAFREYLIPNIRERYASADA